MSDTDIVESFPAMLRRVLDGRLKSECETFPDMFAADGVLEYPYAPPGLDTTFKGRDAIIANFQKIRQLLRIDSVFEVTEIRASDPETIVLEFYGQGEGVMTKQPYDQRYISVIHMRGGQFVHYKDYWNPLAIIRAVKDGDVTEPFIID